MSLSKKNLDKLIKFKKNKNLNNESKNINNYTNITNNDNLITNPLNSKDPNKIFYSLIDNSKSLEASLNEMATITGQKALVTRAKKAIAGFKIREGMPIGCTVTLRGDRMYSFLERFINLALPRIRDFRGVNPKSFDGRGNYTVGVKEQLIFPEISFDKIDSIRGMDITIVTSAKSDQEGKALLQELGMPFSKN